MLDNIDWLIHCPLVPPNPQMGQIDWNWNYAVGLKSKGWTGVWENFCRLYSFWRHIVPVSQGGFGGGNGGGGTLEQKKAEAERTFSRIRTVDRWGPKRRYKVERTPAFFNWLQNVGKPMDSEILAWYPLALPEEPTWGSTYGNPRKLPETSMYLVNAGRMFSNQRKPDGPFVMSIHSRGYKNAVIQYVAPKNNSQVVQEYAKHKNAPMSWIDVIPYPSTISQQTNRRWKSYDFTPKGLRLGQKQWVEQLIKNKNYQGTTGSSMGWDHVAIRNTFPPMYLSIEPQDLGATGSRHRGKFTQSINYSSIPIKYK